MSKKHEFKTLVSLFNNREYKENRPEELEGYILWLKDKLLKIPDKFRASARVSIGASDDDGYYYNIYYYRPETEAEAKKRLDGLQKYNEQQKIAELAQLKRLKAKYETNG